MTVSQHEQHLQLESETAQLYTHVFPTLTCQNVSHYCTSSFCPQSRVLDETLALFYNENCSDSCSSTMNSSSNSRTGAAWPLEVTTVVEGFSQTGLKELHQSGKVSNFLLRALLIKKNKKMAAFDFSTVPSFIFFSGTNR